MVPELTLPQPTGGIAEILDGERSIENSRHVRDFSFEIRDNMKRHAEIVWKILVALAEIAFSEVSSVRVAIAVENAIEERVTERRIDHVVLRLSAHDHLQQRGHSLIKLAFVVDSGVAHV